MIFTQQKTENFSILEQEMYEAFAKQCVMVLPIKAEGYLNSGLCSCCIKSNDQYLTNY